MKQDSLIEIGILGIVGYILFLNSTLINPTLAFIYTILLVVSFSFVIGDGLYGKRQVPLINKDISWVKAIFISLVSYGILILISSIIVPVLAKTIPLTEILSLLATSAPLFSGSNFFNFTNFGILIPYIESFSIFVIAIDFFTSVFKIDIRRLGTKLLTLFIILSTAFLFFHIQSKGISAEGPLILVFFMAFISCLQVFFYREARIPILFHVIANSVALIASGQFASVPFIIGNHFLPLLSKTNFIVLSSVIFIPLIKFNKNKNDQKNNLRK
jgi:hypothetical protein